jgi:predicted transposase YbfD/YdcC
MSNSCLALVDCFAEVEDVRIERTKKHLLVDILSLSVMAVMSGAEGWEEIEEFGKQKHDWLRTVLKLPNGIPSHDTISRVFQRLKPEAFQEPFLRWVESLAKPLGLRLVAIDGKTLRRSHDRKTMKSALHAVCAWCVENHTFLGQQAVDQKSNEITAIPELLDMLQLKGALVTIDAMGCQKAIAKKIVEGGGDYLLGVKDNQPTLKAMVEEQFLRHHSAERPESSECYYQTYDKGHGRIEERHYYMLPVSKSHDTVTSEWMGLATVGQVISYTTRNGEQTSEVRYYVSSMTPDAKRFAAAARGHWGIENSLHWVLDVTFDEDQSRIRKGNGPDNFALLRRFATTIIKQDTSPGSVRRKRKRAGWNNKALLKLITQTT